MSEHVLQRVSLVCANYGNGLVFDEILDDWLKFLGGRPREVVVVDGGSDLGTQSKYWQMFQQGRIDKLQMIHSTHKHNDKQLCFIQEYEAGVAATNEYVVFIKSDTLPYRDGHDDWLEGVVQQLEDPEIFAISGSFNWNSVHHYVCDGWYYSRKCSLNFAVMPRRAFVEALEDFAEEFIHSSWSGDNPAATTGQGRYLVEVAFERYMEKTNSYSLVRDEDETWSIVHTNAPESRLPKLRERLQKRKGLARYYKRTRAAWEPNGVYYGESFQRRIRKWLSRGWIGNVWRLAMRWRRLSEGVKDAN